MRISTSKTRLRYGSSNYGRPPCQQHLVRRPWPYSLWSPPSSPAGSSNFRDPYGLTPPDDAAGRDAKVRQSGGFLFSLAKVFGQYVQKHPRSFVRNQAQARVRIDPPSLAITPLKRVDNQRDDLVRSIMALRNASSGPPSRTRSQPSRAQGIASPAYISANTRNSRARSKVPPANT